MAWIATAAAESSAATWEADAGFEALPHERPERVIVGRQSIRDRELTVVGYELLTAFVDAPEPVVPDPDDEDGDEPGNAHEDDAPDEDHEYLPASVCTSATGIGPLVGSRKVFYRADRALLTGVAPLETPASRIVIEVDERFNDDAEVVVGCTALVQRGYTLALADLPWSEPATKQLLELARIVKIDVRGRSRDELAELMQSMQRPGRQLLADRVESRVALAELRGLPFDFFGGYGMTASGYAVAAGGVPFVESERHRLIGYLHGGTGVNLDRFSSFYIGGGPTGEESEALVRPIIPGASIEEFESRRYAVAIGEYRWEPIFFAYLSFHSSIAYLERRRLLKGALARRDDVLPAIGVRLTTGFLFETQLELEYNYNFGVIRRDEYGGSEVLVHISGQF